MRFVSMPEIAAAELVRYNAMCQAIAECHRVDEVKEIRDRALALEVYARQALNTEAERQAIAIRLRAERRAGQMLNEMQESGQREVRGGDRKSKSSDTTLKSTLADFNITKDQSSEWQELATVPENKFEEVLADPVTPPSRAKILATIRKKKKLNMIFHTDALWVWGRLKDFERDGYLKMKPAKVYGHMDPGMREDVRCLIPQVIKWLKGLDEVANRVSGPFAPGPDLP